MLKRLAVAFLILAVLAGASLAGWRYWEQYAFLNIPPEQPGRNVTVIIAPGAPFSVAARELQTKGLVRDAGRLIKWAVEHKLAAKTRAGEFVLNTGWTPPRLMEVLTSSPGVMQRVQVREGLTIWETAKAFEQAGLCRTEDFIQAARDPRLLEKWSIPADSAEGYLFPETYLFSRSQKLDAAALVEAMLAQFRLHAQKIWPDGPPDPETAHKVVILASLVEKETGDASERACIAGVYANRIKRRMLLQADPSVIYGLGPGFDGDLRRADLENKSNRYNTYRHRGLPPGPICSPGLASLLAARSPAQHNYLYFVAKGDGAHYFSSTLREHNNAVRRYQLRRNRKTYRSY
ncbi:MAG: hypothetical protein PWQ57_2684 [Desulfovibrionales bacterium]|jgi:UPF0755 protein|nr:hypothetical protein [Desulfovibrionales bacterium]